MKFILKLNQIELVELNKEAFWFNYLELKLLTPILQVEVNKDFGIEGNVTRLLFKANTTVDISVSGTAKYICIRVLGFGFSLMRQFGY